MNRKNDTKKQEVLSFIKRYIEKNTVSPSIGEIAAGVSLAKSTAFKYVCRLEEDGEITRLGSNKIILRASDAPKLARYTRMPVLGLVACGNPIPAIEDVEEYIPIDADGLGGGEYFGLRCTGDSMINAGISDGDIVYVRRQSTADDGQIVVAMVEDGESDESRATLKRFFRDKENMRYILRPENDHMEDIVVDNVTVIGVAIRVLKDLELS